MRYSVDINNEHEIADKIREARDKGYRLVEDHIEYVMVGYTEPVVEAERDYDADGNIINEQFVVVKDSEPIREKKRWLVFTDEPEPPHQPTLSERVRALEEKVFGEVKG